MSNKKMKGLGSNGLQNIQASSINSSVSHLNYHNPFGSSMKKNRNPLKGASSFANMSTTSLIYSNRNKSIQRSGSQMYNGRGFSGSNLNFKVKNNIDNLRSSSLVSKVFLICSEWK